MNELLRDQRRNMEGAMARLHEATYVAGSIAAEIAARTGWERMKVEIGYYAEIVGMVIRGGDDEAIIRHIVGKIEKRKALGNY